MHTGLDLGRVECGQGVEGAEVGAGGEQQVDVTVGEVGDGEVDDGVGVDLGDGEVLVDAEPDDVDHLDVAGLFDAGADLVVELLDVGGDDPDAFGVAALDRFSDRADDADGVGVGLLGDLLAQLVS